MEGHDHAQAPTMLDRARKMAEIGRLARERQEKWSRKSAAAGGSSKRAADVPINTKPAGPAMKLVEVPEDLILQIMWEKACGPRHVYSPATWKPRPDDPGDEQLSRVYEKSRAIIRLIHRHVDEVIRQYVGNGCVGCVYEEVH